MTVEESLSLAEEQIKAVFGDQSVDIGLFGEEIGSCPLCGGKVVRRRNFYGCEKFKETGCKFSVNTYICGKAITLPIVRDLLTNKKTALLDGFISKKSGKPFSAVLKLDETGKVLFDFPEKAGKDTPGVLLCPCCGRRILKGKTAYGCAGYKEGCDFRLPFIKDGRMLDDREAMEIIRSMKNF